MVGKLLPELSACLTLLLLLGNLGGLLAPDPVMVYAVLGAEGASLMFFCTLVDIASRLQKRPPWWLAILIVGGVLLLYPELVNVLAAAFAEGWWIFLPLAWSLVERIRELWTLPGASKEEKIRRRTLTFDRLWVGLLLGGAALVCGLAVALTSEAGVAALAHPALPVGVGLVFYATAAVNAWRVHQPRFTKRPTSLVPWLDRGDGQFGAEGARVGGCASASL